MINASNPLLLLVDNATHIMITLSCYPFDDYIIILPKWRLHDHATYMMITWSSYPYAGYSYNDCKIKLHTGIITKWSFYPHDYMTMLPKWWLHDHAARITTRSFHPRNDYMIMLLIWWIPRDSKFDSWLCHGFFFI